MKNSLRTIALMSSVCCLFFSFSNCGSTKTANEEVAEATEVPFVVSDSYFQHWVAGIQEGGKGTKIYFDLESVQPGVTFNTLYFRGKTAKIEYIPESKYTFMADIRTDSDRPDIIMDADPSAEAENRPPVTMPFEIPDTHAAFTYTYEGETRVHVLENIKEKEMIAYPSGNPKGDN